MQQRYNCLNFFKITLSFVCYVFQFLFANCYIFRQPTNVFFVFISVPSLNQIREVDVWVCQKCMWLHFCVKVNEVFLHIRVLAYLSFPSSLIERVRNHIPISVNIGQTCPTNVPTRLIVCRWHSQSIKYCKKSLWTGDEVVAAMAVAEMVACTRLVFRQLVWMLLANTRAFSYSCNSSIICM